MTAWTAEDIRVASLLEAQLGPIRVIEVIEHKENRMTVETTPFSETNPDPSEGPDPWAEGASYPEVSDNPHNHTYTWSPKLPDNSMLVIRSQTAPGLVEAVEAMGPMAGRLRAAWDAIVGTATAPQAAAPIPPTGQYQAGAGASANYNPLMPPPNQPYPGQPAWQQAGALQAPAAQGGFVGGQPGNTRGPKPRPNWPQVYKINVPFAAKDAFKAFREQNQDALKGKVAWAGGGDYWIEGTVAQGFAQYNPMPA